MFLFFASHGRGGSATTPPLVRSAPANTVLDMRHGASAVAEDVLGLGRRLESCEAEPADPCGSTNALIIHSTSQGRGVSPAVQGKAR